MTSICTGIRTGRVQLVGTGPGDPELLTLKALRAIEAAEVVVHDRLVSDAILALVPPHMRRIDVGKSPGCHRLTQDRINALLVDLATRGLRVVRLKGGDPLIFGRGGEEAAALRAAGVAVDVVPGITAAQGVAAATGVPLTHRGFATGVRYVTGHRAEDGRLDLDWASLAAADTTLVVYMGVANIAEIAAELLAGGMRPDLPVLAVASATTPAERRVTSTLARVARDIAVAGLSAPVLFVIGRVVALYDDVDLARDTALAAADWEAAAHA